MTDATTEVLNMALGQPRNVKTFKKHLDRLGITDEDEYKRAVYQTFGDITGSERKLKEVLAGVKKKEIGWNHPMFNNVKQRTEEHDDYLVNPFEVTEGVVECTKCGSRRTFSCQKQVRSSDEPMTTFSRCVDCGHQMTYSG
jgi:DNA-directed RNA polymerase subunit M/transcription elongation factor TFIIS